MPSSTDQLVAACDRLATPRGARVPLPSLARASRTVDPYIKASMPDVRGLPKDPLDAVAYANPLGYLPEIRARSRDSSVIRMFSSRAALSSARPTEPSSSVPKSCGAGGSSPLPYRRA